MALTDFSMMKKLKDNFDNNPVAAIIAPTVFILVLVGMIRVFIFAIMGSGVNFGVKADTSQIIDFMAAVDADDACEKYDGLSGNSSTSHIQAECLTAYTDFVTDYGDIDVYIIDDNNHKSGNDFSYTIEVYDVDGNKLSYSTLNFSVEEYSYSYTEEYKDDDGKRRTRTKSSSEDIIDFTSIVLS